MNCIFLLDQLGIFFNPSIVEYLSEDLMSEILGGDVDEMKDEFMDDVMSMIPDKDSMMQMENDAMSKYQSFFLL